MCENLKYPENYVDATITYAILQLAALMGSVESPD